MPDGFTVFGYKVHFYGILVMLGALAAAWLASREAKRRGLDPEMIWDMLPWLLIAGIIGARIWHILTPPASMVAEGITTGYYLTHPLDAIAVWNGGLGIPGAVMGGVLAMYFYVRRHKQSLATWLDIIAPGLALAQAIGRWGNFFNQELYGAPSTLPWAIYIDPAHRLPGFENQATYQPLFAYEFVWDLLNMGVLLFIARRSKFKDQLKAGDIFALYLVIYPIGRFFLEFLRLDPSLVGGIDANQTLMAALALVSAVFLIWRHRSRSRQVEAESSEHHNLNGV
jgi:phosphatidylglycerol:prolipoprotein diacylglycerol transferase